MHLSKQLYDIGLTLDDVESGLAVFAQIVVELFSSHLGQFAFKLLGDGLRMVKVDEVSNGFLVVFFAA